eukprot:sb/3462646/
MPCMSYTTPFQYGAQVCAEYEYKIHEYIDDRKVACFRSPLQSPYPRIDIDLKYFKILCEDVNDVNKGDINGQTALHALCLYGSINSIKIILEAGADLGCEDHAGFSAAHYCAMADRADLLAYLDRNGVSITKQALGTSRTPLHVAAICNSVSCTRFLLSSGVNLNQVDNYGYSALWLAMYYGNDTVCRLLSDHGAQRDVTEVDKVSFVFRCMERCPEYSESLLDSYVSSCPYRAVSCVWLNNVVNGVSYENTDLTHSFLYLSDLKRGLLEHPALKTYTSVAWSLFGRKHAVFDLSRYLLFTALWTFSYLVDSGKSLGSGNAAKLAGFTLLIPYTVMMVWFMAHRTLTSYKRQLNCLNSELAIVDKELDNLHPCMWNAYHVLRREKRGFLARRSNLQLFNLLWDQVADIAILVLSLGALVFELVLVGVGSNVDRKIHPEANIAHTVITSSTLLLVWACTFNKLQYFNMFGSFLVGIKNLIALLGKFSVLFVAFYFPTACVFWKTLFESTTRPTLVNETTPLEDSNSWGATNSTVVTFWDAFYRVYRMAFVSYDYSSGLGIATNLGIPDWWNILTFYWITMGSLILLRIFGAIVFAILSEPVRETQYIAHQVRFRFICQIVMLMSCSKRQSFSRYLELDCKPYITDKLLTSPSGYHGNEDSTSEIRELRDRVDRLSALVQQPETSSMGATM